MPKTCDTEFPDPDDLLTFKLIICPDEVRDNVECLTNIYVLIEQCNLSIFLDIVYGEVVIEHQILSVAPQKEEFCCLVCEKFAFKTLLFL